VTHHQVALAALGQDDALLHSLDLIDINLASGLALAAIWVNNRRMTRAKIRSMNSADLFEAWRSADHGARLAERVMLDEAMRSVHGMCDFPSSTRMEQTEGLRADASELFIVAMAKMDPRSKTCTALGQLA
jgi:hypothetical protein